MTQQYVVNQGREGLKLCFAETITNERVASSTVIRIYFFSPKCQTK